MRMFVIFFWLKVSSFQHTGMRLLKAYLNRPVQVINDGTI